MKIIVNKQN